MKKLCDILAIINGALKVAAFLALIILLVPVTLVYKRLDPLHPYTIPRFFHHLVLRLLGIRLRVYGEPATTSPVLFAANHVSYLDVIILGSLLPASFIAKSEVASWPLFGFLARIQNTVFIERRAPRAAEQRTQLQELLAKRQSLILFPEGTSSDGLTALHFKSSLFGVVEGAAQDLKITVQPVSLTCTELDGFPILREERALYAWYGDMTLVPHLWNVFKHGKFTLDVVFHQVLTTADCPNRKVLAATCQDMVARGIEHSLAGHAMVQAPTAIE
jgi:1-acyl-sn-glycerol-3-phosphate acyltransferase